MATMKSITARGTRLEQLKALAKVLATGIDACKDCRALPQLTKQYRETIREIEEIEGAKDDTDEIGAILAQREHGRCRSQRKRGMSTSPGCPG